jgi:serine phosphatase RsbU (regulator of sigma subunit)
MSERVAVLRVVVASPGDVQPERDAVPEVLEQLNRSICRDRGIRLEAVRWETDTYPGFHPLGPQGLIDPILRVEDCDVLIGVFWKRFGSSVSTGETGTEHEICRALESWKIHGRPEIMVYFNRKSYTPKTKEETDQWGRVLEFREKFPEQGLLWQYKGKTQFKELLRDHLSNYILRVYPPAREPAQDSRSRSTDSRDYFAVQAQVIEEYDRTFIGRDEVQNEFDVFLKSHPRGYFIVRGGPGQGKTAVSCRLIKTRGYVHHLVSRTGGRTDPRLILRSLLSQIRSPGDSAGLPESLAELIKVFEESLLAAASRRTPLVVVIDALDELPPSGNPAFLVSDALPDGVFFWVTARPCEQLDRLGELLFAIPHRFHDLGPLSLGEMRSVLQARKPGITSAEVERVAEVSQGNPLYLRAVADLMSAQADYNLQELPPTIEGFYRSVTVFLRDGNDILREILGLLSVARTALSVRELSALTGRAQREIDERVIRLIQQFLLEISGSYTFYHEKFHEFVTHNILYEDELRNSHAVIAQWLQRPANGSNPYRWASLAFHLFESGDHAGLLAAITPGFLAEKVRRFGYAVLEDVELCVRSLLEAGDPALVERCVSMVESVREVAGGDIIPDAARAANPYRAGPESFRTNLIEPTVPSVPGLEAYVGVLPKAEIPADFFEIVPHGGRLAVAIGDVPSLGLKSAFAARFVGNLFHRLVANTNSVNLADLLARINSTVVGHEYFRRISMQCVEVNPLSGILHIASAGHPYPVHYSACRGKCDILPVRGDLLHDYLVAPAAAPAWEQYGLEIAPGDIIVLVSDGLTEGQLLEGDPYAYRFAAIVEAHAKQGARTIGEAILDDWKAHPREEDSADDVSVIVIAVGQRGSRKPE